MQNNESTSQAEHIAELQRQLHKFSNAIAEFEAMGAELRAKRMDARVADMLRLNREAISAMQRSIELVEERLKLAESRARTDGTEWDGNSKKMQL